MKKFVSLLLAVLVVLGGLSVLVSVNVFAASASISYSFKSTEAGYAQGTVTLKGDNGTYYLYWADDTAALDGYAEITSLTVSAGQGSFAMPQYTAIPADATKLIAIKSSSEPTNLSNSAAAAVYDIPQSKQLSVDTDDALYTFGAISDPQLANDSYGSGSYPYDEVHLAAALETLAKRGVDFTISSGDTVNDQNGNATYAAEFKRYQRILADSSYANPIYEANGNHDVGTVWNKNGGYYNDNTPFVKGTGINSVKSDIAAGKPYFEVTEPTTGDHFIFMALEGGFYTDRGTQFSTAQLDWLEGLLKKYRDDGKNIFIIEHGNIAGWGAGDKESAPYYYDLGLNKSSADVARFIKLMETYKDCVVISGHTHLELSAQYNYSDNGGTSAVTIHNSAIGGVRRLVNGSVDRTAVKGLSEGYIVEVYEDCVLFNGTNMYYNEIMPQCSYIVPMGTSANGEDETTPTESAVVTEPTEITVATEPTETTSANAENTESTEPSSTATVPATSAAPDPTETTGGETTASTPAVTASEAPTTTASTAAVSTTATTAAVTNTTVTTESLPVDIDYLYGDADLNGKVNVKDATTVQKYAAKILNLEEVAFTQADVTGDLKVNVKDATSIQKLIAKIIDKFPVEENELASVGASVYTVEQDLEDYYTFSSYDQYMALKKAYKNSASQSELATLQSALYDIAGARPDESGTEITVYFSNTQGWSTVCAHIWGTDGDMASWPGTQMTYVRNNSSGQGIYKITLDYSKYQKIIFNNNNNNQQTVDISLTGENNVGYYISGGSGKSFTVTSYTYGE